MPRKPRNPLLPPTAVIREWAVIIGCDPKSIEREIISPGTITGAAGQRIRKGLPECRAMLEARWAAAGSR